MGYELGRTLASPVVVYVSIFAAVIAGLILSSVLLRKARLKTHRESVNNFQKRLAQVKALSASSREVLRSFESEMVDKIVLPSRNAIHAMNVMRKIINSIDSRIKQAEEISEQGSKDCLHRALSVLNGDLVIDNSIHERLLTEAETPPIPWPDVASRIDQLLSVIRANIKKAA